MKKLKESIEKYGIMTPLIVLATTDGIYQIVSGHRRKHCTEQMVSETLPKSFYRNWEMVKKIPNLTGDFMWTGWDKLIWGLQTDPTIGVEPYTHADDFAATSMWRNTDAVESWSWEGCEGRKFDIVMYTQGGFVQLGINGKTIGKKKLKEKLITAEGETRISAKPEKTLLQANGQDLCFINLDLIGENGITKSSVDQKLTVTVEGLGVLQAFGSARPNMAENFYSDTHTTCYGKALAVVRAGSQAGEIKATVSGKGLEPISVTITVE